MPLHLFMRPYIAKPVNPESEPTGKLAGIASRILMKVLFAARVARLGSSLLYTG